jgi:hypothetical protein
VLASLEEILFNDLENPRSATVVEGKTLTNHDGKERNKDRSVALQCAGLRFRIHCQPIKNRDRVDQN